MTFHPEHIIFLHLPKYGGNTLHEIISKQYLPNEQFVIRVKEDHQLTVDDFINLQQLERNKIKVLRGHQSFGLHKYFENSVEYFTLLRHPVDRIVSYFNYVKRMPNYKWYQQVVNSGMTLQEFVDEADGPDIHNAQIRLISGIDDAQDKMLNVAIKNIGNYFGYVGLLEEFDDAIIKISSKYNWKIHQYKIRNKSRSDKKYKLELEVYNHILDKNMGDYQLYSMARNDEWGFLELNTKEKIQSKALRARNLTYAIMRKLFHI